MPKFFVTIILFSILQQAVAQPNMNINYAAKWKSVETAFSKGLNQTAQNEIESILKLAKADNNAEQTIKALCNLRVSMRDRDEKSRLNDIQFFEKEMKEAKFPTKQILYSMLGDLYWSYYEENRWKILDRTQIVEEHTWQQRIKPIKDIETWSANDFYNAAYIYYSASLSESDKSKNYSLKNISEIVEKGKNTAKLRPTLYDFLVHRAIDYFQQEENELTKPAYAFEINDENAFAPINTFVKTYFKTSDTTSQKYQVIKLYQDILSFHLNDADPSALIDADLARLHYVNEHSILLNDNELYFNALKALANQYPNNEHAAMASAIMAEYYAEGNIDIGKNAFFNAAENPDKINFVEAKKLCDAIIEKFPNSEASSKAEGILQQIEQGNLQINTEKVVLPNQASLAMITFKNVKTLYCKVVKISVKEVKEKSLDYNNDYQEVVKRNGIKNWSVQLPVANDYKSHTTEIKIDALPLGVYAVIVSEDVNFDKNKHYALAIMNVSNLSYITGTENEKSGTDVYVVHRETGEPQKGVEIKTWINTYDYNVRKYNPKAGPTYMTDQNGYFKMIKKEPYQSAYTLELIKGDDDLYLHDNVYINEHYEQPTSDYPRTFLFTDRSIYRPGQKIYFKGIMIMTHGAENRQYEVIANRKTQVTLKDVNRQDVQTIDVTTNEYGSFSGTFTAPDGLLTGQFQIVSEAGQSYFNIEEYKRPKFEVTFDTIQGSYKLNEEVKIKGLAKAFAGNTIDGATVKYRVIRNARFPYYWCFYRWGQPSSPEMEIAHGTTTTKADGSFDISFKAIPDGSIDKQTMPVFDYEISADVTDLNGETRSGTSSVSVSYQSLVVRIETEEKQNINDFNAVKVFTTNLGGTHIPSQLTLTLKKLVSPTKTYRAKLWGKVDKPLYTEKEFHALFPLDEYEQENNHLNWKEEKIVWTKTFNSTKEGLEYLQKTGSGNGWYVLEAKAIDKDKNEVLDKKYIRLLTLNEALPNEHLLLTKKSSQVEPNEKYSIHIATPYEKVFALCNYRKQTAIAQVDGKNRGFASGMETEWQTWNTNHSFEFDITEADRGGFYTSAWYVKNNRYYSFSEFVIVPWTNKELTISLETFRDKMLPGSEQEWKLKISGTKKEKVSAEVLATMYDASLDAFKPHRFQEFGLFPQNSNRHILYWNPNSNFQLEHGRQFYFGGFREVHPYEKEYQYLKWWNLKETPYWINGRNAYRGRIKASKVPIMMEADAAPAPMMTKSVAMDRNETGNDDLSKPSVKFTPPVVFEGEKSQSSTPEPQISLRSNFAETAFFFPQLQTDAEGNIILKFKAPDALTRWKLMTFAHTKAIQSSIFTETATTSKELMIVPNTPRFFREGDKMVYSAKVTNLSEKDIKSKVSLQLIDAITNNVQDSLFKNMANVVDVYIKKGQSERVEWHIEIPTGFTNPIKINTIAEASNYSDGEQNVVPVLLNSMLVTETLPLPVRINSSKDFIFKNLLNSNSSNTIRHYNLTLEYTGNPAWYAVQALPYLTDYPYECAEQTFNRYYANVLATHIANSSPKVKEIFSTWENKDTAALLSNLQKNQALKSALLQETPWVLEAKSEVEQKRNIAHLFNLNRMSKDLDRAIRELQNMQTPNGGFTWFKGMPVDRFMTQYIVTGIGRLMHIGVTETGSDAHILQIVEKALPYLDARIKDDYDQLIKDKADMNQQQIDYTKIQYLYMRSFFKENEIAPASKTAFDYFKKQAQKYWLKGNRYMQGMTALALNRFDDKTTPQDIIKSLRENAIRNEEMGMYWKENTGSWWWYEAPIETQSLLVEVFKEIGGDDKEVDELKIWLLKNKQTTNWKTTKATSDAIYALLLNGTYWLSTQPDVEISLGKKLIQSKEQQQEAGTGYFKTSIPQEKIDASMGKIHVEVKNNATAGKDIGGTTWGAVYWQYFENLDKIESHETPLSLKKQLYKISNSDKGEVLTPITDNSPLNIGDKVKVRIELRVDRAMEYVHMKDMRGACFEPINVLSNYKYQGGLGYYESTKDASTNFFFSWLNEGTYVFEYPMFVTNQGDYSNGIATIQCMYAPEFSSHSEGIRVLVK